MKQEFSFYEFAGVVLPGATLFFGLAVVVEPVRNFLLSDKFGAGQLGLLLIASYIAGHLVQGVGNVIEKAMWAFRGIPSTWIRRKQPPYLSAAQTAQLPDALSVILGHNVGPLTKSDASSCRAIAGQLYARLEEKGRVARINIFNGNYGLFRGIASSLLLVVVIAAWQHGLWTEITALAAGALFIALLRMHRFGVHYASELYRQCLNLAAHSESSTKV